MGNALRFLNKNIEFTNTNSHGGYGGGGAIQQTGGHSNACYGNSVDMPRVDPIWVWDQHEAPGVQHRNAINMVPGQHLPNISSAKESDPPFAPCRSRFRQFLDRRKKKKPCCDECAEHKKKEPTFKNCCGH